MAELLINICFIYLAIHDILTPVYMMKEEILKKVIHICDTFKINNVDEK